MKNKKLSEKKLAELDIETTEDGFVVWIVSKNSYGQKVRHWILDASMLKKDGEINLGNRSGLYNINAIYDGLKNSIIICKTKFNKH